MSSGMRDISSCSKSGRIVTVMVFPLSGGGWQLQVNGINEEEYNELIKINITPDRERMVFNPNFITCRWNLPKSLTKGDNNFPPMPQATLILNTLSLWSFEYQNKAQILRSDGRELTGSGLLWTLKKNIDSRMM